MHIVIEGPDGSGKTTITELLERRLKESDKSVTTVREPGGCEISETIREVILGMGHKDHVTNTLLFSASRRILYDTVVYPALTSGDIVISDRSFISTYVYQVAGGNKALQHLFASICAASRETMPDLTIILTAKPEVLMDRICSRTEDRNSFDPSCLAAVKELSRRYWDLADVPKHKCDFGELHYVSTTHASPEEVVDEIFRIVFTNGGFNAARQVSQPWKRAIQRLFSGSKAGERVS